MLPNIRLDFDFMRALPGIRRQAFMLIMNLAVLENLSEMHQEIGMRVRLLIEK